MRTLTTALAALVLLTTGCAVAQQAASMIEPDNGATETTAPPHTISPMPGSLTQHNGPQITEGGRLMFPNSAGQTCASLYGYLDPSTGMRVAYSMPCELALNVCLPDGTTLMMPAQFACTAAMATLDEACAEQPEYAAWYGCLDRKP